MALAVGNILQLTDVQTYLGQQVLNVYFYRVVSADAGATLDAVIQAFNNEVVETLRTNQADNLNHVSVIGKNLTNGIDIFEQLYNENGLVGATEETPSFVAYGFRLLRTTAATRHGSKRIAGVPEGFLNGNTVTFPAGEQAAMEAALATNLAATGTVGADFEVEPVIIGRYPLGNPNVGELDLSVVNPVSGAQFIRITTQTTRRAGRGS